MNATVIRGFKDKRTAAVFAGRQPKGFPSDLVRAARRKLGLLEAAATLDDLRSPPGNRLEALRGDREGCHSLRVNDQFRVVFAWREDGPHDVEVTDYH